MGNLFIGHCFIVLICFEYLASFNVFVFPKAYNCGRMNLKGCSAVAATIVCIKLEIEWYSFLYSTSL